MLQLFSSLFDYNKRELKKLETLTAQVNAFEEKTRSLTPDDFPRETARLKKELHEGTTTLEEILPWAYALTREAARRSLNMRHYDVQIMAGIALHQGKIVEQKTGEGKTLTATTALYLNALLGKGVHLVTVNDYLARVHAGWMGVIYHYLGLSTSAIIADKSYIYDPSYYDSTQTDWRFSRLREVHRKEAYQADITYGINSEFGFDFLRDNMATQADDVVQRDYYYAIIDEADSILIDEARTPHIISAPYEQDTSRYYEYARIVSALNPEEDYIIDEKLRTANLTDKGIGHIEKMIGVDNIYEKDFETLFHIEAALKAETLYKNDKEYIVRDGEVLIVDEFTGRLLAGRRFSEGIHQAIEAKENVAIQRESKTLATASLQNYFRMYTKLAGMTGTAATEAEEFHKIYKTEVLVMPTHRPMVRNDHPDMIYKTEEGKYNAVADEIARIHAEGRPILIGTTSIEKNELLSRVLTKKKVPHVMLNAKNHVKEAEIIADAGKKGMVTVATNMAGRGVDIILGGEPPTLDDKKEPDGTVSEKNQAWYNKERADWQKRHDEVVQLGGLYVIGTERHESRRIDNQLRGRAGRQGDPGDTIFFVSLSDELMRIFGGEQISKLMTFLNFPEDQPLSHGMVSKAIEQAQIKVEGFNFDMRKHLVEFDDVLNKQRDILYEQRHDILNLPEKAPQKFKTVVLDIIHQEVQSVLVGYAVLGDDLLPEDAQRLKKDIETLLAKPSKHIEDQLEKPFDQQALLDAIMEYIERWFAEQVGRVPEVIWFDICRRTILSTIDRYWTEHLTAIEDLRQGINLRGYAQMDPLVEYKNEAYRMFEQLLGSINADASRRLLRTEIMPADSETEVPKEILKPQLTQKPQPQLTYTAPTAVSAYQLPEQKEPAKQAPIQQPQKIGRNDPCWCGSGKKYKKCHG